jgi:hypothetical protein
VNKYLEKIAEKAEEPTRASKLLYTFGGMNTGANIGGLAGLAAGAVGAGLLHRKGVYHLDTHALLGGLGAGALAGNVVGGTKAYHRAKDINEELSNPGSHPNVQASKWMPTMGGVSAGTILGPLGMGVGGYYAHRHGNRVADALAKVRQKHQDQ